MHARNSHGFPAPTAHAIGMAAESRARGLLESKNYHILAHRYKTKGGEIDLVAKRGDHLAFVEVKRRKTQEEAAYAIEARQQARIAVAAEIFFGEHSGACAMLREFRRHPHFPKAGLRPHRASLSCVIWQVP